eukprot:gnl/MRDRNA2_/MRDRNA2_112635_c0_seq1.p1 gnl/MRDRNA2_/MRDRNA2_112635_c0~~gnl/MRDRNA2_/MRDRNA2_112635_c0_seq1.p1  ORF type:complete len:472 (-),score=115.89 gnl/MRDRNA2_/MRDRNA2_112635_c0_seq1:43-1458(-)
MNKWRTATGMLPPVGQSKSPKSRIAAAREMMASTAPVFGNDSLEEENKWLREELARIKNEVVGAMNRRSMAMVAGGGFRGPGAGVSNRMCDCEQLREKLARCQNALEQSREKERRQAAMVEAQAEALSDAHEKVQFHAARAEACASFKPEMCSASSQTDPKTPPIRSIASQTIVAECERCEVEVQVDPPQSSTVTIGSQTSTTALVDAAAQYEQDVRDLAVQATVNSDNNGTQTEAFPPVVHVEEVSMQTEATGVCVIETQTDDIETPEAEPCEEEKEVIEVEVQTEPLEEPAKATASKGVQAVPRPRTPVERGQQTEPSEDDALVEKLRLKISASETVIEVLGLENAELKASEKMLQEELKREKQQVTTWQKAAQSKVFGHLNVLVVSPKAECTVRGESLDMTSWDISRIQSLIEEEVIPRFTRVFAYEGDDQPPEVRNAIDGAMKEFASTFRMKLSEMLQNAGPKASRG